MNTIILFEPNKTEVTPRWATWHPFSVACIDVLNPTIDAECDGIEIFDKEEDETEKLAKLEIQYTFLIKATGNGNWTGDDCLIYFVWSLSNSYIFLF